jgi:hypothetical protein
MSKNFDSPIERGFCGAVPLPGLVQLDRAGKVWLDAELHVIVIDGVRVDMDLLAQCVNPVRDLFYSAERKGDEVIVTQYTRQRMVEELQAQREVDKLAHGMAYESAVSIIESNCVGVDDEDMPDWFNTLNPDPDAPQGEIDEAVKYL